MPGLITVLPHRNETGIELTKGGVIRISQTDDNGENSEIHIHVSDAHQLIQAIDTAIKTFKAEADMRENEAISPS